MSGYVLEIRDLTYSHDYKPLLSKISLDVSQGEALWIQGPNGSGKSTLLKLIAGFLNHYEGSIQINTPFYFITSESFLAPNTSVKSYLQLCANLLQNKNKEKIQKIEEILKLGHLHRTDYHTLSLGQRQRLSWVPFFLQRRLLWIMDEPFNHLDEESSKILEALLHDHIQKQGCVVYASHLQLPLNSRVFSLAESGHGYTKNL